MLLATLALPTGLLLLVWSADRFVDGAAATARHLGMPPLLIGMVIVGFGTSAPEMLVSALSALQGSPGIALGNAYGSNIANIALILGVTSLLHPLTVQSRLLRQELPLLAAVTLLAAVQLADRQLSRGDALLDLLLFALVMGWSIRQGLRQKSDPMAVEMAQEMATPALPRSRALLWLAVGLAVMVGSSRLLVWGAVICARALGVSDMVIGLTIIAIGTSLPELASSIAAARKGEHDLALGNVLGSNLFNTLAVVGIAGAIAPMAVAPEVLWRDLPVMGVLTLALAAFSFGGRSHGRINRLEGGALLASYVGYLGYLLWGVLGGGGV